MKSALKSCSSPISHFKDEKSKAYQIMGKLEPNPHTLPTALPALMMTGLVFAGQAGAMNNKHDIHVLVMCVHNTHKVSDSPCSVIGESFSEILIDL